MAAPRVWKLKAEFSRQALLVGTVGPEGAATLRVGQTICRYNPGMPYQGGHVSVPGCVLSPTQVPGHVEDKAWDGVLHLEILVPGHDRHVWRRRPG